MKINDNEVTNVSETLRHILNEIYYNYAFLMPKSMNLVMQYFLPIQVVGVVDDEFMVYVPVDADKELLESGFFNDPPKYAMSGKDAYPDHGVTKEGFVVSIQFAEFAEIELSPFIQPSEVKELTIKTMK